MFKNYVTVAIRNLTRNKVYVLINTFGMGIAMACCMTAYLLIAYNIEFDSYFKRDQVQHVVKVLHHYKTTVGERDKSLVCPIVMAPLASQEIAGIEDFTRFCNTSGILSHGENAFNENLRFADLSFFNMFNLGLIKGTVKNFEHPQSIILSESSAKKYFGDQDPVGETLTVELNGKKYQAIVGGVLEKVPLNISFNIDALMHIETYLDAYTVEPGHWDDNHTSSVLFKLADIGQRQTISQQMDKYVRLVNEKQKDSHTVAFELVPFTTPIINGEVTESNLRLPIPTIALFIFSTLGLIILLIACFNLTNTTLALTGKRLKEIGVRKVVGSGRNQIVFQFLLETGFTVSFAIVAGLLMAQVIVPQFAMMWQLQYGLNDLNKLNLMLALIILLFIAAIIAGMYPALLNSKFNPIELIKGKKGTKGTTSLTRGLLVIQFALSVIVLVAGIVFTQNAAYQDQLSLGYDKEKILTVSIQGEQEYNTFKNRISENPKIESIAGAYNHIGPYTALYNTIKLDTALFKTNIYKVGIDYFRTVGLSLVAGRDFIDGNQTDLESAAIIDENFATNHGLKAPIDAQIFYNEQLYRVVGVVNNHLSGLKQKDNSEHVFTLVSPSSYGTMVVRTAPNHVGVLRANLEKEWKLLFPGRPFESKSQKDLVFEEANGYNNNLRQIFFFITILGCLLSGSGIYALASLNVQKRTREIGIRKVLGANVRGIVGLLNKEFAIILGLAAILGSAGGYILTNSLLSDLYAQHVKIGFHTIALGGFLVFLIGILTTTATIMRTAAANPTETLRTE